MLRVLKLKADAEIVIFPVNSGEKNNFVYVNTIFPKNSTPAKKQLYQNGIDLRKRIHQILKPAGPEERHRSCIYCARPRFHLKFDDS